MKIIEKNDRLLLISPHPDDIEFGCGASIFQNRNDVFSKLLVLSNRKKTRGEVNNKEEQEKSGSILGIDQIQFEEFPIRFFDSSENRDRIRLLIRKVCNDFNPDVIFIPAIKETMQDHSALSEEVIRIIRDVSIVGYEVIKHNRYFHPNAFISVSKEALGKKIEAINCFEGQNKKYYFDNKIIEALATIRAANFAQIGFAEAFEVYNLIQK